MSYMYKVVIFLALTEEEKESIEKQIHELKSQLNASGKGIYEICMERKFLKHRIADLEYKLEHEDDI